MERREVVNVNPIQNENTNPVSDINNNSNQNTDQNPNLNINPNNNEVSNNPNPESNQNENENENLNVIEPLNNNDIREDDENYFKCTNCNKMIPLTEIDTHEQSCIKIVKCQFCNQSMEESMLKDHLYAHQLESEFNQNQPLRSNNMNRNQNNNNSNDENEDDETPQPVRKLFNILGCLLLNEDSLAKAGEKILTGEDSDDERERKKEYEREMERRRERQRQLELRRNLSSSYNPIDSLIDRLPSTKIELDKNVPRGSNNKCIICYEVFEVNNVITTLPCAHIFHTNCVRQWLHTNNHCPICKCEINTDVFRKMENP